MRFLSFGIDEVVSVRVQSGTNMKNKRKLGERFIRARS
jgi:hypothetical protein